MSKKANLLSVSYTGVISVTYPALETRKGPMIVAETGAVATIKYGAAGSAVPVGTHIEQLTDQTDVFIINVTSGTVHVVTDDHTNLT